MGAISERLGDINHQVNVAGCDCSPWDPPHFTPHVSTEEGVKVLPSPLVYVVFFFSEHEGVIQVQYLSPCSPQQVVRSLSYLGRNVTMADRCQLVTERRGFWEYTLIALLCCFSLGSLLGREWVLLLLSHVVSAN